MVDDYAPFRRIVRSLLQLRNDLEIIGEASDGLEAVQIAKELRPDLIVLDIDLPNLNGIQAARRLRDIVPRAKILFLSVDSSPEVVREAFNAGGAAYIYKLNIGSELIPAIETVLRGSPFVGSGLEPEFRDPAPTQAPAHRHEMFIYSDDAVLLQGFTTFTATALRGGDPAIVVASKPQLDSVLQSLSAEGLDVAAAVQSGTLIASEVTETLAGFMFNDLPDPARFANAAAALIQSVRKAAAGPHRRIAACGICAPSLWAQGKRDAAVWLERLWDDLAKQHDLDILCAYSSNTLHESKHERAFKAICSQHTAVYSR